MNKQKGAAMITAVIFFLSISIIILIAMASPVAIQVRTTADFLQSKQGYIAADTLNEEALYRLNKGRTLPSNLVLSFSGATSTALITDIGGAKQIISTGVAGSFSRLSKSIFSQDTGVSINYGLQVGNGGLVMSGSSRINGNVYANGNISASGSCQITGSAVAAVATTEFADQENSTSGTPAVNTVFGTTSASQDAAQSFTVSTTTAVAEVSFYIKKTGSPANATVKLVSNNSGNPSTTVLASGTLSASQVTTSYGWVDVGFTTNPSLTPGTTYWVVIDVTSNSTINYYTLATTNTNSYANGQLKRGSSGGTWTIPDSSHDGFFKVYVGGVSSISGVIVGSGGVGDANAFTVVNSTISGNLYCQVGSGNNKTCNTAQPTASFLSFPFSSANIDEWKSEAVSSNVYNGNLTIGSSVSTTTSSLVVNGDLTVGGSANVTFGGPIKVNGNFDLGSSGNVTLGGTMYVTGDLTVSGSAQLRLASSYGASSGMIVVDGKVDLGSSGGVSGSGTTGSYIVIVSNSSCGGTTSCSGAYAINVTGSAGAVVLLTQNGGINFGGSAGAKAAVGYLMNMSGSVTLTYESGLADINFSSGPSGTWNVDSWQEISQ